MLRHSAPHVQSHALWRCQEPCDGQRLWHLSVATIQWVPHTPLGSAPRAPALFHTQGQSRRECCWKWHRHCGQDLEVSVPPGVTAQGTWHCHLQQHLGLGTVSGQGPDVMAAQGVLSLSPAPGQSCPHTWDAKPGCQRGGRVLLTGRASKPAEKCEALGITALSHLGHVRIDSDPSL